jgi:hypothetical protein
MNEEMGLMKERDMIVRLARVAKKMSKRGGRLKKEDSDSQISSTAHTIPTHG